MAPLSATLWVVISSAPSYEISNQGDVRRLATGIYLRPYEITGGHPVVAITDAAGKRRALSIQKLLREAFPSAFPSYRTAAWPGLSWEQVAAIRALYKRGNTRALARAHGVSRPMVARILKDRIYHG